MGETAERHSAAGIKKGRIAPALSVSCVGQPLLEVPSGACARKADDPHEVLFQHSELTRHRITSFQLLKTRSVWHSYIGLERPSPITRRTLPVRALSSMMTWPFRLAAR